MENSTIQSQLDSLLSDETLVITPPPVEVIKQPENQDLDLENKGEVQNVVVQPQAVDADSEKELANTFFKLLGLEVPELSGYNIETIAEKVKEHINPQEDAQIQEFKKWREIGGDLESYSKIPERLDYAGVVLEEDDVEAHEAFVREYLENTLDDADEIEDYVNMLKDTNKLYATAVKVLPKLDKMNEYVVNEAWSSKQKENEEQQKIIDSVWSEVATTVESGVIGAFKLNKDVHSNFKNYVLPDKTGVSKAVKTRESLTVQQNLLVDLFIMNNFDPQAMMRSKAETKTASSGLSAMFGKAQGVQKEINSDEMSKLNEQFKTK